MIRGARLDPTGHKVTPLALHPLVRRAGGAMPPSARVPSAPIMDQGRTSSCVEHAWSAGISPQVGFTVSQADSYRLARMMERADRGLPLDAKIDDNGTAPNELDRGLSLFGVRPRDASADYDQRNSDADPETINRLLSLADVEADAKTLVLGTYRAATPLDMQVALAVVGKPVGVTIYADAVGARSVEGWDPTTGPLGVPDESAPGAYHGVLVVGYRTLPSGEIVWDVQNSWGVSYGVLGFFSANAAWAERTQDRYVLDVHTQEAA